nr:hypothetical protein GCM10020093_008020 [Planobispora longispora]
MRQILGRNVPIGRRFMTAVGDGDPAMARWLMQALCLIADNYRTLQRLGSSPRPSSSA